jgi:hypothetical protein
MKRSIITILVFLTFAFSFLSCGNDSNIKKILREDATTGSMNWLEMIEENGVNFEWDGSTLLGEAIKAGRVDMVEALIKDKVDVNRPALYVNYIGQTIGLPPLLITAAGVADAYIFGINIPKKEADIIRYLLLKAGANVKTDLYDSLLIAMYNFDEASFDVALPKYNKDMLDYSSYGKTELESGRTPFGSVFPDMQFDGQKTMLQKLMNKGIQFGFYDIQKALEMYLNPNLDTYADEFLEDVIEYMANQSSLSLISGEPHYPNEGDTLYMNPLDLAISQIYAKRERISTSPMNDINSIASTFPMLYEDIVELFGDKGLRATPYRWSIGGYPFSGTLPLFLDIIAERIKQEVVNRNTDDRYSEDERNAEVYKYWTPEKIISAFESLNEYDALYLYLENTVNHGLKYAYPPDYLYGKSNIPASYTDLFEPYYPVFEWLEKNGYLRYGVKEYLTYEDGLSRSEFFSTYQRRIRDKNTIANDPNDPRAITLEDLLSFKFYGAEDVIIEEAQEIIRGERTGFSDDVRKILIQNFWTTNLKY